MVRARAALGASSAHSLEDARTALYAWLWACGGHGAVIWSGLFGESLASESIAWLTWLGLTGESARPALYDETDCQRIVAQWLRAGAASLHGATGEVWLHHSPTGSNMGCGAVADVLLYRAWQTEAQEPSLPLKAALQDRALGLEAVFASASDYQSIASQAAIRRALGDVSARYVSLPMFSGERMPLADLEREGVAPEALVAYLAALGWPVGSHPERQTLGDLVSSFSLTKLWSAPAPVERERLWDLSRYAWQQRDPEAIIARLRPRLERAYGRWHNAKDTAHAPHSWLRILVEGLRGEAHTLQDMERLSAFAFLERAPTPDAEAQATLGDAWAASVLRYALHALSAEALATPLLANAFFREVRHHFRDTAGIRGRLVMFPIRAALAGTMQGPCLGVMATLLGMERCAQRIQECLACMPTNA